jgi:hypothetical protein
MNNQLKGCARFDDILPPMVTTRKKRLIPDAKFHILDQGKMVLPVPCPPYL